jgi:hypothetical protein
LESLLVPKVIRVILVPKVLLVRWVHKVFKALKELIHQSLSSQVSGMVQLTAQYSMLYLSPIRTNLLSLPSSTTVLTLLLTLQILLNYALLKVRWRCGSMPQLRTAVPSLVTLLYLEISVVTG